MELSVLHISIIFLLSASAMNITITECDNLSEIQLNLYTRQFIHINFAKIIIIHEGNLPPTLFYVQKLLVQWFDRIGIPVLLSTFGQDYEDPSYDNIELFSWSGEQFSVRSTQFNKSRHVFDDPERAEALYRFEDKFGVVVIIENLIVLDKYLHGSARRPFHTPRGEYVISVMEEFSESWHFQVEDIFRRLWINYGISRAIIFSTCDDEVFFRFDPLERTNSTNSLSENITVWGVVKSIEMGNPGFAGNYFDRHWVNFNGHPIRTVFFERSPTAIPWGKFLKSFLNSYFFDAKEYSKERGGFDGILYGNLIRALNFTPITMNEELSFGFRAENGTYLGSIGDVLYGRAGLSVNPRFIQNYGTNHIEFLYPIFFEKLCIIAPKARRIPQSMAVFKCYNPFVWILIIISIFILGSIWEFFKKSGNSRNKNLQTKTQWTQNLIEMMIIMTTGVSAMIPHKTRERVFLSGCVLISLIIGSTFQGSLITAYTARTYYKDIDTLKELDETGLSISTSSKSLIGMFGKNQSSLIKSLERKFFWKVQKTLNRTAYYRDTCSVERLTDFALFAELFQSADGTVLLHAVKECPRFYGLAYIVRKGWPFLDRFNNALLRFSEAGLIEKWYDIAQGALIHQLRLERRRNISTKKRPFSIKDMQSAFFILFAGLGLSMLVFLFEYFHKKNLRFQIKRK